ncbi:GH1 family beta-glucosidase [[Clostridium] fimetarium]|uniref:Beta-glucosidase n=1 Tax=[Clostridium] fimetarium TaxID=99656 RepID=A0A1I0R542_9FIRM|nr:GH1 family beta-glucosidase [[Clostridium] fimetarium]SEW35683.1 beta-glucosidase [[Clostridium] fimetarium]
MSLKFNFQSNFVWGVASSAYQIEGGWDCDGKGPSIWDAFCHENSNIANAQTGDISCNHYENYLNDIKLMHSLGINAYRFSISWPRVFPNGDKVLNSKGLEFYDKLVDALIEYNITPYITLYHWDLPQALEDQGGWQNRDTAVAFSEYAAFICKHFSTRVKNYITINEPQIILFLGYHNGIHAPGLKLSMGATLNVIHNLALAHGMAVNAMRLSANAPVLIGFSSTGELCYPYENQDSSSTNFKSSTKEDIDTARSMSFTVTKDNWMFCHTIFCDAVCLGKYPDILGEPASKLISAFKDGDMEIMHQPIDFLGVNIYNGHCVDSNGFVPREPGFPRTALKWPITPEVMNWGTRFIYERYQLPIYITENGLSCHDKIYLDGKVHDQERIDFLQRYLLELEKSYSAGTDISGYFHWSFTDNFEWHNGYEDRFGLIYIDYQTQERIPKDSALWYKSII